MSAQIDYELITENYGMITGSIIIGTGDEEDFVNDFSSLCRSYDPDSEFTRIHESTKNSLFEKTYSTSLKEAAGRCKHCNKMVISKILERKNGYCKECWSELGAGIPEPGPKRQRYSKRIKVNIYDPNGLMHNNSPSFLGEDEWEEIDDHCEYEFNGPMNQLLNELANASDYDYERDRDYRSLSGSKDEWAKKIKPMRIG